MNNEFAQYVMSSKQAYNNLLQEWFVEQTKEIF
jgi:hypothetical protein